MLPDEARDKLISEIEEMLKGAVKGVVGDVFDINTVEKSLTELLSLVRKKVTEGIFQQIDVTHMECKVCGSKMENRGYVSRKI
ncbi:MAG: ISKra4 family transposase, partial [Nitrospirae bacterium]|nr:ISKra4 family transposase [Nitrospirota bacterium]